jgi:hypothetical protein
MPHLRPLLPQPRPRARTSRARAHLLARVRGTTQGGGRQGGGVDRGTRAAGRPFFYFFDVVVERRKMRARERGAIDVVKEAKKSLFLPRRNPLSPPSLEGPPLRKSTMQSSVALRAGSQIRPAQKQQQQQRRGSSSGNASSARAPMVVRAVARPSSSSSSSSSTRCTEEPKSKG